MELFGAVQAQDHAGGKRAPGQRTKGFPESAVEQAFAEGHILRTHALPRTWHFVKPPDIRWMLELTAPRMRLQLVHMDRQLELKNEVLKNSQAVLGEALQGKQ